MFYHGFGNFRLRLSTFLIMLYGGWPMGGKKCSLNQLLGQNVNGIILVAPCVDILNAHLQWDPGGFSSTRTSEQELNCT